MTNKLWGLVLSLGLVGLAGQAGADLADDPPDLPDPIVDTDFYEAGAPLPEKVELGRLLFFDKVLSGNQNVSCATCHHPSLATADGVALGLGEGAEGLGRDRRPGRTSTTAVHGRVPRNSPALFNLGAQEFRTLYHDGRIELDEDRNYASGFISPASWKLPVGLDNPLAVQAMFPVTSPDEMAGQKGENPVADAVSLNNAAGPAGVWEQLGDRLAAIPEYVDRFRAAFPDDVDRPEDISFVHAANAIAAFEATAFRADNSPFDLYLRGRADALSSQARRGMAVFYGAGGCSSCHSGKFQTDHDFHAIAMPQVGPGKADGRDGEYWRTSGERAFLEDFGRGRVTVRPEDNFKFRTPSLRNVAVTGPWGHAGTYDELEQVVRHHLDPVKSLETFDGESVELPPLGPVLEVTATGSRLGAGWLTGQRLEGFMMRDRWVQENEGLRKRIADANELEPVQLAEDDVRALIAFLESLTDSGWESSGLVPERVPSGLKVDR